METTQVSINGWMNKLVYEYINICKYWYHCMHLAVYPWCVEYISIHPPHIHEEFLMWDFFWLFLAAALWLAQQKYDVPASLAASCTAVLEIRPLLPKVRPCGVSLPGTPGRHVISTEIPLILSSWASAINLIRFSRRSNETCIFQSAFALALAHSVRYC